MKNTPAVTREEIIKICNITSDKARVEFEEKVLPKLKGAFERYSQAVEAVAILRQKTHEMATLTTRISSRIFMLLLKRMKLLICIGITS